MLKTFDDFTRSDWIRIRELARRADVSRSNFLASKLKPHLADHDCFDGVPGDYRRFEETILGFDQEWEISVEECVTCRRRYLRAFLEDDGMPKSGRWFMGELDCETLPGDIKPSSGLLILAQFDRLYYGGSYWGHTGKWSEYVANFRELSCLRVMDDAD